MLHAALHAFRPALASLIEGPPRREDVETVVDLHLRMAEARLGMLARTGRARPGQFGLPLEDLALDCVAELFERDAEGRFGTLAAYYGGVDPASAGDVTLLSAVRRLVWNAVDQALYRRHREHSPARSKQLRVLKRALRAHPAVRVERVGRTLVARVVSSGGPPAAGEPMPPERLAAALAERLAGRGLDATTLVQAVVDVLGGQTAYVPEYPVTRLASVALAVSVAVGHRTHVGDGAGGEPPVLHPGGVPECPALLEVDVAAHVAQAAEAVRARLGPRYVGRAGLDADVFDAYVGAARHAVAVAFGSSVPGGDGGATLYEALRARLPGLSAETYRAEHRTRLEYVSRCVRDALFEAVRDEVVS